MPLQSHVTAVWHDVEVSGERRPTNWWKTREISTDRSTDRPTDRPTGRPAVLPSVRPPERPTEAQMSTGETPKFLRRVWLTHLTADWHISSTFALRPAHHRRPIIVINKIGRRLNTATDCFFFVRRMQTSTGGWGGPGSPSRKSSAAVNRLREIDLRAKRLMEFHSNPSVIGRHHRPFSSFFLLADVHQAPVLP